MITSCTGDICDIYPTPPEENGNATRPHQTQLEQNTLFLKSLSSFKMMKNNAHLVNNHSSTVEQSIQSSMKIMTNWLCVDDRRHILNVELMNEAIQVITSLVDSPQHTKSSECVTQSLLKLLEFTVAKIMQTTEINKVCDCV